MTTAANIPDVAESTLFTEKLAHLVRSWPGTQKALAAKVGISPQMMSQYMRGVIPKPHLIRRLAIELEVIDNLPWLLDEDDRRLEPPAAPSLDEAGDEKIIEAIRDRYIAAALKANSEIDLITGIAIYEPHHWQCQAIDLLTQKDAENAYRAANMVKGCMLALARAERLWQFAGIDGNELLRPHVDGSYITSPEELKYPKLKERWDSEVENSPGLKLIVVFTNAITAAEWQGEREERAQHFYQRIAPFFLARVITDWSVEDHPRRDEIMKTLREKGYIQEGDRPVDMPEFIAWHPDDAVTFAPREDQEKTTKPKKKKGK